MPPPHACTTNLMILIRSLGCATSDITWEDFQLPITLNPNDVGAT